MTGESSERPLRSRGSLRLLVPFFAENRGPVLWGALSLILVDFLQLYIPRIIKRVVDDLTLYRATERDLLLYALSVLAVTAAMVCLRYVWRRCLIGLSRKVEEGLRNRLFSHLQTLSDSYFGRVRTGDLMAHATNDIGSIRMATGMGLVALIDSVVLGSAAIGFMIYINLRLTLYVLLPMILVVFGTRIFTKKMHALYQLVQASFSDLTEIVRERFNGIRIVKAYNREEASLGIFGRASNDLVGKSLRLVRITGAFFPMMILFSNLSLTLVLLAGGRDVIAMTISPGDFVAFISYLAILTWPMMATGWVINLLQRGRASLDRISRILEEKPEIVDGPLPPSPPPRFGRISLEGVSFSFGNGGPPALREVNLAVGEGDLIGIVGPPGSGKSTLLHLLPRLYDPSEGTIRIDGIDIRTMKTEVLRAGIAFVPQEPFLFAGTIRENLLLGNPLSPEGEIRRAVEMAQLSETVEGFPEGLETVVGEKGIVLSGGQKQRIALARAFLKDSPIFVLDDPTSQLDMETGTAVMETIRSLAGRKTILLVSHRISAVRSADRILVLENGRIAASGTHGDLIRRGGYYETTFRYQEIEETDYGR
jgi:ATP-binding cassette subfamily B protein